MTNHEDKPALQVLISTVIPTDAYPLEESDDDYKDRLTDFGPYDLYDVESFEDLSGVPITAETKFIAFLIKTGVDTYESESSLCGVIATVYITGSDELSLVAVDGKCYRVNTGRMPNAFPPEAFGLTPFPWNGERDEQPNFMRNLF